MLQTKHSKAPQKMPNFQFSRRAKYYSREIEWAVFTETAS